MGWHCQNCKHWIVDDKYKTCTYCGAPRYGYSSTREQNRSSPNYGNHESTHYSSVREVPSSSKKILVIAIIIIAVALVYFYWKPIAHTASNVASSQQNTGKSISAGLTHTIGSSTIPKSSLAYIAQQSNDSVAILDTKNNSIIGSINLAGKSPNNIVFSSTTGLLYTTDSYYNYHTPQYHGVISIINSTNYNIIGNIPMDSVPISIAISSDGTYGYTINNNNTLSSINLQNGAVINSISFSQIVEYKNLTNPNILSGGCISAYSQQYGYNTTCIYNNFTRKFTGIPTGFIYSPTNNLLYVLVTYNTYCSVGEEYGEYAFAKSPCNGQMIFALNGSNINQTVWQMSLNSPSFPLSGSREIATSTNGNTLYVLAGYNLTALGHTPTTLSIINISTQKVIKNVSLDSFESEMASLSISPSSDYIYVMGSYVINGQIIVVNTSTKSIVDSIPLDFIPSDAVINSNFVYVEGSGELAIIARSNDTVINTRNLSGCPCEIVNGQ